MKKLVIFLVIPFVFSCTGLLDEKPKDFYAPDLIFKNTDAAELVLNGISTVFNERGVNFGDAEYGVLVVNGVDDMIETNSNSGFSNGNINSGVNQYNDFWKNQYDGIVRANVFLEGNQTATYDETLKKQFEAEARVWRGHFYLRLLQHFGGVPLILDTKVESASLPRATEAEVYAQILKDLTWGLDYLPEFSKQKPGRVSKGAAKGILARAHLFGKMFDPANLTNHLGEAKRLCGEIIASGEHALLPVKDVFKYSNDNKSEWMLDYPSSGINLNSSHQVMMRTFPSGLNNKPSLEDPAVPYGNGWNFICASDYLLQIYDKAKDERFKNWLWDRYVNPTNGATEKLFGRFFIRKYNDVFAAQGRNFRYNRIDLPILRYPDVLLMYAEAENEINGPTPAAFQQLNVVRARAGLTALSVTDIPTKDALRNEIQNERCRELFGETLRYSDLIRWGIYLQRVKVAMTGSLHTEKNLRYPIPAAQINLNPNLVQNPGY